MGTLTYGSRNDKLQVPTSWYKDETLVKISKTPTENHDSCCS